CGASLRSTDARLALRRASAGPRARRGRSPRVRRAGGADGGAQDLPARAGAGARAVRNPHRGTGDRRARGGAAGRTVSPVSRTAGPQSGRAARRRARAAGMVRAVHAAQGESAPGRRLHAPHLRERLVGADRLAVPPPHRDRRVEVVSSLTRYGTTTTDSFDGSLIPHAFRARTRTK